MCVWKRRNSESWGKAVTLKFIILGSSAAVPTRRRKCASALVVCEGEKALVDCGPGTTRQLRIYGQRMEEISLVWLSHAHMDHVLGIRRFLRRLGTVSTGSTVRVYGNRKTMERVSGLLRFCKLRSLDVRLHVAEHGTFHQNRHQVWRTFPLKHRAPNHALVVQERPHRLLNVQRAEELGVPHGHARETLLAGKAVTLTDGRRILPEDVLGPTHPGRKIVFVSDTMFFEGLVAECEGADLIVCESTFPSHMPEFARRWGHMTAAQAAWLAREAGARRLVLTHLSRWAETSDITKEARAVFPHTLVAEDFSTFLVPHHTPETSSSVR